MLEGFVGEHMICEIGHEITSEKFYRPIKRNNPSTFTSLYEVGMKTKGKQNNTIIKADRSVLQRLITAYGGGR